MNESKTAVLGLKRGMVELYNHQIVWEINAKETIHILKAIFKDTAVDIQHVGSTAILNIKAKPIIDIAVGVISFEALAEILPRLEANGIYKSTHHAIPNDILYAIGDFLNDTRTHHIHIVPIDSEQWQNFINLRDYFNACPQKAIAYENLKVKLVEKYPDNRNAYTDGKDAFITECLCEARIYAELRQQSVGEWGKVK